MKHRSGVDYIDRTIETVRNHRDADNCWPQWANIFADEIEDLRADLQEAVATIEGLADQQAMADDWYREPLARLKAVAK
jgi:hypothetical protein